MAIVWRSGDFNSVYIYLLLDDEERPFYVGRTTNIPRRLRGHRKRFGYTPDLIILDTLRSEYAEQAERNWIDHYLREGAHLINLLGIDENVWQRVGDITFRLKSARQCWRLRTPREMKVRRYQNTNPKSLFPLTLYIKRYGLPPFREWGWQVAAGNSRPLP